MEIVRGRGLLIDADGVTRELIDSTRDINKDSDRVAEENSLRSRLLCG